MSSGDTEHPGTSPSADPPARPGAWVVAWEILRKDLLLEVRSREFLSNLGVFLLLVLVTLNLAFQGLPLSLSLLYPGTLWVAMLFSTVLASSRSVMIEMEERAMRSLALLPVDRSVIYLGKVLGLWLFLLLAAAGASVIGMVLFQVSLKSVGLYGILLVLATFGLAALGILQSVVGFWARTREMLLPLLVLPLAAPLLLGAIRLTQECMTSRPMGVGSWLALLLMFDLLFLTVGLWLFEEALEE